MAVDISQIAYKVTELMNETAALVTVTGPALRVKAASQQTVIALVHARVSAISGTSPTLDVDVETSMDGDTWSVYSSLAQLTTTTEVVAAVTTYPHRFIRVVATIGGTTPSVSFIVEIAGVTVKEIEAT